jgi:hypothetical protein
MTLIRFTVTAPPNKSALAQGHDPRVGVVLYLLELADLQTGDCGTTESLKDIDSADPVPSTTAQSCPKPQAV